MYFNVTPESVNYDYLYGEPESHRTWFLELRNSPTDEGINRGSIIKYNANGDPGNVFTEKFFRVIDIHGRSLVIEPISPNSGLTINQPIINVDSNRNCYNRFIPGFPGENTSLTCHDCSYGTSQNTKLGIQYNELYPRSGKYLYSPRPNPQYKNLATATYKVPKQQCNFWSF